MSDELLDFESISPLSGRKSSTTINLKLIDIATQTKWSWLKDVELIEKLKLELSSSKNSELTNDESVEEGDESSIQEYASEIGEGIDIEEFNKRRTQSKQLESVGPPKILQYTPDSKKTELETIDNTLKENSEYIQDMAKIMAEFDIHVKGGYSCEFCGQLTLPWPSISDQEQVDPSKLYCCSDYREYVETFVKCQTKTHNIVDQIISIKPVDGKRYDRITKREQSKVKQKVERTQERLFQRALERQLRVKQNKEELRQPSFSQRPPSKVSDASHAIPDFMTDRSQSTILRASQNTITRRASKIYSNTNSSSSFETYQENYSFDEYLMAKNQLKSINYQLSNLKYVHDGWTVRLPSPFELDEIQPVQNKDISLQATVIPSAQIRTLERRMTVKYFRNGNISFILFPNGTGNVYYENGRLAIIISQVSLGMHIYIVLSNDSCQQIIAVFDPYGNACCNFGTGKLRIQISPFGGYEINQENDDAQVIRRKRWLWWDFKDHVHAPPFQPFLFSLNENICVKIHSQENIYLSYRCEIHQLSFRVGSRLKINKPESLAELQPFDSNEAFLKKRKNRIEQLINLIKDSTKKNNQGSVKQITVLKNKIQSRLDSEILPKAKTGILKDARNVNISQMSTHRKDASKLSKFLIVP